MWSCRHLDSDHLCISLLHTQLPRNVKNQAVRVGSSQNLTLDKVLEAVLFVKHSQQPPGEDITPFFRWRN